MITKALRPAPGTAQHERHRPRSFRGAPKQEAVMRKQVTDEADARPITSDELPPELKGRVKALIYDLSNDDLPMALLDMAHLYRALRAGSPRNGKFEEPVQLTEDLRTLIFSEDRDAIEEICMGPTEHGECTLKN